MCLPQNLDNKSRQRVAVKGAPQSGQLVQHTPQSPVVRGLIVRVCGSTWDMVWGDRECSELQSRPHALGAPVITSLAPPSILTTHPTFCCRAGPGRSLLVLTALGAFISQTHRAALRCSNHILLYPLLAPALPPPTPPTPPTHTPKTHAHTQRTRAQVVRRPHVGGSQRIRPHQHPGYPKVTQLQDAPLAHEDVLALRGGAV